MQDAGGGGGGGFTPISPYSPGSIATALDAINVDRDTIDQIVTILKQSEGGISDRTFEDVPEPSFGGSSSGGQLGYHTALAHQKVSEAMNMMMADLEQVMVDVLAYQRSQEYVDDMNRLDMENIEAAVAGMVGTFFGPRAV